MPGASLLEIALAGTAAASTGVSIYSDVEESKAREKQIKMQETATKLRDTQASISRTQEMMQIASHNRAVLAAQGNDLQSQSSNAEMINNYNKYARDQQIGNSNMSLQLQELQEDAEANHAELAASIFSDAASGIKGIADGWKFDRKDHYGDSL